nr:50S ribosomal protein L23 [Pseudomonas brassicacearum subsp. brassicacearum]
MARTFPRRLRFWQTRKASSFFKVATDATKLEIKKAVESLFSVKVERVTTLNVLGKSKRTARGLGKRNDWKKAVISLQPGQDLDFSSSAE